MFTSCKALFHFLSDFFSFCLCLPTTRVKAFFVCSLPLTMALKNIWWTVDIRQKTVFFPLISRLIIFIIFELVKLAVFIIFNPRWMPASTLNSIEFLTLSQCLSLNFVSTTQLTNEIVMQKLIHLSFYLQNFPQSHQLITTLNGSVPTTQTLTTTAAFNSINSSSASSSNYTVSEDEISKKLPKEILLRILSYLDVVSLCRCAQVSVEKL